MVSDTTELTRLTRLARAGDGAALQRLRDMGFFEPKDDRPGWPVSHAQQRLWLLDRISPGEAVYNMPGAVFIDGPLDRTVLGRAFAQLAERHESLRTTFVLANDELRQVTTGTLPALVEIDLSAAADAERQARDLLRADAGRPFDLATGPLARAMLVRLSSERHVFSCNLHHIVCDAWSQEILLSELFQLYAGNLPAPPATTYRRFAAHQRAQANDPAWLRARDYWRRQLHAVAPLHLPTDRPRPREMTHGGANHAFEIDAALTGALTAMQRAARVTPFQFLTAVIKVLLQRYSGQSDIVVGAPISGRDGADLAGAVGNFVNTLVLRDRIDGTCSFDAVLAQVKATTEEAYEHAQYPFDLILGDLELPPDLERSPLFDVAVIYQDPPPEPMRFGALSVAPFETGFATAKFDLSWYVGPSRDGIRVVINYNDALFGAATVARMAGHFGQLLSAIVAQPGSPIAELEIVTPAEQQQLLNDFNDTAADYPQTSLIELFEEQVALGPERIAIGAESGDWTYRHLNGRANAIAAALRSRYGVEEHDRVAVLLPPSPEAIAVILGVLKAGAAYVPLDPVYPPERLTFMLEDAQPRVLVTDATYLDLAPAVSLVEVRTLTGISENPPLRGRPRDLAYIIYTSGSTGVPKGCCIEHRNVVRLLRNSRFPFAFSAADTWILAHSLCFDFSVWEMFGALLFGGRLIVPDRESVRDADVFHALVRRHRVTVLNQTPAGFAAFVAREREAGQHDLAEHLRYVVFGGDRLEPAQLRDWTDWYPLDRIALVNMFGITETTVHVTFGRLRVDDIAAPAGASPVGVPLPETTVYVMNAGGRLQPAGVPGELFVGGTGVCRGYLGRPDLDAERFVAHPYSAGERLYKSGDLGRWTADGRLEHLGRNDAQVQVRGYRVELAEIEARLLMHPAVRQAVVIARNGVAGSKELIAYLVPRETLDPDDVRRHLRAALPEYMVPAYVVAVDAIPLTANNKIDRTRLPAPENARLGPAAIAEPRDGLERALHAIWCRVLALPAVSIDESYFNLGGDSIKVIALINAIAAELGIRLAVKDVFRTPTIVALAVIIRRREPHGADAVARGDALLEAKRELLRADPAIRELISSDCEDFFPMSDIESGMIFHSLLGGEAGIYHDQAVFEIVDDAFDPDGFRESLRLLARKHAILRTSFHLAGEPIQIVRPEPRVDFAYIDRRTLGAPDAFVRELLAEDLGRPFDPALAAMWRMRVVHAASDQVVLVWSMHHAIIDGWSNASLLAELIETYTRRKTEPSFCPAPLRASYRDVVSEQLRIEASAVTAAFWSGDLTGAERTPLPLGAVAEPGRLGGAQRKLVTPIGSKLSAGLLALARSASVPVRDVYLAAFHCWLELVTGKADLLFGLVGHTRPAIEDGDRIVGCCLNTIPFRARLDAGLTPHERIRAIHARLDEIRPHDKLSTRKIAQLAGTDIAGGNQLFDILFNFIDFHVLERLDADFLASSRALLSNESTNTLVDLSVSGTLGAYRFSLFTDTGTYSDSDAARLSGYFVRILEEFDRSPGTPVDIPAVLGDEARRLLAESSGGRSGYPRDSGIAALVEEQTRLHPEQIAVECGDARLSFAELNARANGLALALRETFDLQPQERVAIRLPRSELTVVAMLAVLKAGGAYVSIDTEFPAPRVALILGDAGCRYVLSVPELPPLEVTGVRPLDVRQLGTPHERNPVVAAGGTQLAYVMYTSGSTGTPKGSLVEQRSIVRLVRDTNYVSVGAGDRIAQAGSIGFDASTFEIWGALLNGARVVLLETSVLTEPARLREALQAARISIMFLTTSLFNQCAEAEPGMFAGLRVLLTGGENASAEHFEAVRAAAPATDLIHVYGPTENTTFSTFHRIARRYAGAVPIGRPIANSTAYVLDRALRLVPHGVPGEICTGGDGVARGYLNAPELTARAFVPDPFDAAGRLYRTGDLGRRGEDGAIQFLGRVDEQVKVRGFRVEPGEVEAALRAHPAVVETIVIAQRSTVGTADLVAYYTSRTELQSTELRTFLKQTLPGHMVPAHLVHLAAMPMSFTGKIDRRALPAPGAPLPSQAPPSAAARSEAELLLAGLWATVLGRASVGIDEDYFELGGDSIKAIQLSSRLQQAGWKLEMRDLFALPTIAQLAPKLRRTAGRPVPEAVRGPVPASPVQRWFFANHAGPLSQFNMSLRLRSRERLDEGALRAALETVWRHHDALRFTVTADGGEGELVVDDQRALPFDIVDATEAANLQTTLQLAGPLFRAALVRGTAEDHVVLILHHLITDAVSSRIILDDLERAYAAGALPLASDTFGTWTRHLLLWAQSDTAREEAGYWSGVLDRTAQHVPLDRTDGSNRYGDCRSVDLTFSEAETSALLTGKPARLDVPSVLITALTRALGRWHGHPATSFTLEGHGREPLDDRIDVSRTVGWFTSIFPFRADLIGSSFAEQAQHISTALREIPNRGGGFLATRYLAPAEVRARVSGALPRISFNYLGEFADAAGAALFELIGEAPGSPIDPAIERANLLDVTGVVLQRCLRLSFTYSSAQLEAAAIATIAADTKRELLAAGGTWTDAPMPSAVRRNRFAGVSAEDLARVVSELQ